jgi:hypothetical protein
MFSSVHILFTGGVYPVAYLFNCLSVLPSPFSFTSVQQYGTLQCIDLKHLPDLLTCSRNCFFFPTLKALQAEILISELWTTLYYVSKIFSAKFRKVLDLHKLPQSHNSKNDHPKVVVEIRLGTMMHLNRANCTNCMGFATGSRESVDPRRHATGDSSWKARAGHAFGCKAEYRGKPVETTS